MPIYSYSRLSMFEECPRAYKFQYIERPRVEEVRSASSFMGSRVHEVLERLYQDLMNGKRDSFEELKEYYDKIWRGKWTENVQILNERYSQENYKQVGEECIRRYYEKHEPFDRGQTIGTELLILLTLSADGKRYTFQGKIDRLTITPDGCYEIHDYKTTKKFPSQREMDEDRQLSLYQMGVQQKYPDVEDVNLIWHYLRFGKDLQSKRTHDDLKELERELVQAVRIIERARADDDFPTKRDEGADCDFCNYRHLCPEWRHLYETETLPTNDFLSEDGVVLVDELTEVEEQLNRLEERSSDLREKRRKLEKAILEYADRKRVSTVYGTNKKATVKTGKRIKFPRKDEKGRKELEQLIREFGCWDEVASLRLSTLKRISRNGDLPEELLERLEEFKRVEESRSVKLEDSDNF